MDFDKREQRRVNVTGDFGRSLGAEPVDLGMQYAVAGDGIEVGRAAGEKVAEEDRVELINDGTEGL